MQLSGPYISVTFIALLSSLCAAGFASAQCESGWVDIEGQCFNFVNSQSLSWADAGTYCESQGAILAQVKTGDTLEGLMDYISDYCEYYMCVMLRAQFLTANNRNS